MNHSLNSYRRYPRKPKSPTLSLAAMEMSNTLQGTPVTLDSNAVASSREVAKTVEAEGKEAQRVYNTDEEDRTLVDHIYKPGRRKQSDIFSTEIRQWFLLHGDGDPNDPRQWRYVRTFDEDLNRINHVGKYTMLSNDVASRIWKNSTYAKQEIALSWPLDFSLWRN